MKNISMLILIWMAFFNESFSSNSPELIQIEAKNKVTPLTLNIAFYEQIEEVTSLFNGRSREYSRGHSSEIKQNYFLIKGTESLSQFIEETHPHDLTKNPNATFEEYPFILSLMGVRGEMQVQHIASLMIPRPAKDESIAKSEMALIISSLISKVDHIPFTKDKLGKPPSPRELERHSPRKHDLFPRFLEALRKNCQCSYYVENESQFTELANQLFIYTAEIINELKRLYVERDNAGALDGKNTEICGMLVCYHAKLTELINRFSNTNGDDLSLKVQKEMGAKILSPRKKVAITDISKNRVVEQGNKSAVKKKVKRRKKGRWVKVKKKKVRSVPEKPSVAKEGGSPSLASAAGGMKVRIKRDIPNNQGQSRPGKLTTVRSVRATPDK